MIAPTAANRPAIVRPLGEVLKRASDSAAFERWQQQVKATGYCSRPVRLAGRVRAIDKRTGECRDVYNTSSEPDGTLLTACGQRREAVCPSCAATYRGDAWQIVAAGLRGGKGVPDSVAAHPLLFVTLTAPSFGAVHSSRLSDGRARACRPRRRAETCPHGVRQGCWARHSADDPCLGQPLCRKCFDYERAVLWNALAPELWRRTAIGIRRALARARGITQAELRTTLRVSYVKVGEYQRRGALHFHVIVRLDAAQSAGCERVDPPPAEYSAELLEEAVRAAVSAVRVPYPQLEHSTGTGAGLRWGGQLEVRPVGPDERGKVAAYIAKYATKSTEAVGGLVHPLEPAALAALDVSDHVRSYLDTAWHLGGWPELGHLRLRRWAHTLAYRGHCFTKSRRYSTTFGALRKARADYAAGRDRAGTASREPSIRTPNDEPTVPWSDWRMVGIGYLTAGDSWLAATAGERARHRRATARSELASAPSFPVSNAA